MSPLPAVFALGDTRVHICSMNGSNVASNIEVSIDQSFNIITTLSIPNIYLDNHHIGFGWDLDDS